ncbi:GNAT family N-acetyltransferase [Caulobacter mirabilis]|uniref:GNAT family N-acetyltransferase n=1 Tax=Caulobacter mirabilis TaxID=69666 RepID=UPI001FEB1E86|nr:GNAT family N-acetyltransferase [Caulobacter mirabilis]
MQDVVNIARVVETLPDEFEVILADAASEGVRNMALLARQWASGEQRFEEPGALFAARVGGALAGVGGVSPETGPGEPAMRMRRLYVRPDFRRMGVARALAGAMMQQGFQAAPRLTVNAAASVAAGPFWAAMGFEPSDRRDATHIARL